MNIENTYSVCSICVTPFNTVCVQRTSHHTASGHPVHASLYACKGHIDMLFKQLMRDSVIRFLNYGLVYINK